MKRRGFLLAMVMLMIPVSMMMVFSLTRIIFEETGFTMQAQKKAKAFYVCQGALGIASHVLGCNNFRGHTHESDGTTATSSSSPDYLLAYTMPDLTVDAQNWYTWSWNPGQDLRHSYTRSGVNESFRFQVFFPSPNKWRIVAEGNVGGYISRQELNGVCEPLYSYVEFDNGDTKDFSRAEQHAVQGKIHANGNLYLRPWSGAGLAFPPPPLPPLITLVQFQQPATLKLQVDSMTASGKIIRSEDHFGNPDPGGDVYISKGSGSGPLVKMNGTHDPGGAYDSNNANWRDPGPSGAISTFGGTVVDTELGATKRTPPARQSLTPGGYYDLKAGVHIDMNTNTPWASNVTFYNQNEAREVTVKQIDVGAMSAAGAFPSNGIIYANAPVRLVNAARLPGDMTFAASGTVYTKGDFNKDNPDGSGAGQSHSAALMTTDRVYNLTSSFDDAQSYHYPDPIHAALTGGVPPAHDPPLYSGDPADVLEINGAIMDGAPSRDVRAWVNDPANPYYVSGTYHNMWQDTGVKQIPDSQDPANPGLKTLFPNADDLLENLQGVSLQYKGATIHAQDGILPASFDNAELSSKPWETPWIIKSGYIPPEHRTCIADPGLISRPPPGAPNDSRKTLWRVLN